MIRVILESLAFRYKTVLDELREIKGRPIEILHIVGGGIQNQLLNQFTADATGTKVIAGPVEATASGNIIIQAKAVGQIASIAQGRQIIRKSYELKEYLPQNENRWQQEYEKFKV